LRLRSKNEQSKNEKRESILIDSLFFIYHPNEKDMKITHGPIITPRKAPEESEAEMLLRQCREAVEKSITGINRSVSGLEHLQKLKVYEDLISKLEMTAKARRKT
jgi:hypothetical protein